MPTITKSEWINVEVDLIDALDDLSDDELRDLRAAIDEKLTPESEAISATRQQEYMESLFDSLRRNDERRAIEIARTLVCDALGRVC